KDVVVGGALSILGPIRITNTVRPHILSAQREPLSKPPIQDELQSVVTVASATSLCVDFGESIRDSCSIGHVRSARTAVAGAELAYDDSDTSTWVHDDAGDPVRNSAQEQISSLAADVTHRQDGFPGQFLLN